jgi:hypothetical protein
MMKRTSIIIFLLMLILTACAARQAAPEYLGEADFDSVMVEEGKASYAYEPEAEAPMSSRDGYQLAGNSVTQAVERMVIKNADLSIVVDDPGHSMDAIAAMAEDFGGFVVTSNLYQSTLSSGAKVPHAAITIRVPAERLDEALSFVKSEATEVLSENVSGQDVTREYTDLSSRLRNLESAEAQLANIMDEATETEDVLEVYNNLVSVREQIEVIKGQMEYYQQAAALSAVSVDLTADEAIQPLQIGNWQPVGTAKDAVEALINTLQWLGDVAIWVVLCVLPVGIIVGIPLWFVIRKVLQVRKQRKESKQVAAKIPEDEV